MPSIRCWPTPIAPRRLAFRWTGTGTKPALNALAWTPGKIFDKETRSDADTSSAIWKTIAADEHAA